MDEAKRDEIQQWLIKSQRDLGAARLLIGNEDPYLDIVAYHCQQAAEKSLKAYLTYQDVIFRKTHNLQILVQDCLAFEPGFSQLQAMADVLNPYATEYRYPGSALQPEIDEAELALEMAQTIVNFVRSVLPDEVLI